MELLSFKHGGNIGDVFYALPTIKDLCAVHGASAVLYLNPSPNDTVAHLPIEYINAAITLLNSQLYIHDTKVYSNEIATIDYNLDTFRECLHLYPNVGLACSYKFGVPFVKLLRPSLEINDEKLLSQYQGSSVIFNRSFRYRNNNIDYAKLIQKYTTEDDTLGFIGLQNEYDDFVKHVNTNGGSLWHIEHYKTKTFLEVACYIKNARVVIGNCSSPFAIATVLGKDTIQEVDSTFPSCIYPRSNALYALDNDRLFKASDYTIDSLIKLSV